MGNSVDGSLPGRSHQNHGRMAKIDELALEKLMKRQDDWIEPYFCIMEIWLMGWQDGRSFLFCKEETTKVTKAWGRMLRF